MRIGLLASERKVGNSMKNKIPGFVLIFGIFFTLFYANFDRIKLAYYRHTAFRIPHSAFRVERLQQANWKTGGQKIKKADLFFVMKDGCEFTFGDTCCMSLDSKQFPIYYMKEDGNFYKAKILCADFPHVSELEKSR